MNHIDVTRPGRTRLTPTGSGPQATHQRIVATVRWLLNHTDVTQRELADLLDVDVSVINRSLIMKSSGGPRERRRDWRAHEVFRLAMFFDLPVETFYGTNVEEVWEQRMTAAREAHNVRLQSLDEGDD
jgi:hypothetical protein